MRFWLFLAIVAVIWAGLGVAARSVSADTTIVRISSDPFSAPTPGQHHTEVEPDILSNGSTIVAAFQMGRVHGGGSTDTGWATYSSGAWQSASLPALTQNSTPPGSYQYASDPAVAYDAKHGVWIISSLGVSHQRGVGVSVNTSPDGLTWGNAIPVVSSAKDSLDKDWITCDNSATSPYFGNCYIEYDDSTLHDIPFMTVSSDGGQTWSHPIAPPSKACCLGGVPQVQPNGTVIVPIDTISGTGAFRSTNGGASWSHEVTISKVHAHGEQDHLRASHLPSSAIDANGTVYVVWKECNFEPGCSANDIVMSTSSDGVTWSPVQRLPIDPVGSGVDHFIPGLGIDPGTAGNTAHLALTYYYYPKSQCGTGCDLDVGFVSSTDGGATWSRTQQLAGPMSPTWLASTSSGYMVGDYIATTFLNGVAYPAFAVAQPPHDGVFDEAMYSATLPVMEGHSPGRPR